jgi:RHS repeat-associated protein
VLAEESGNQTRWFLADHQGTVKDVVDASGAIVDHVTYDSFGRIIGQTGNIDLRFAYTGREWDEETGQYYYRARYYDAAVGRFISEDPITFNAQDTNLSRYVGNNLINKKDSSGLIDEQLLEQMKAQLIWCKENIAEDLRKPIPKPEGYKKPEKNPNGCEWGSQDEYHTPLSFEENPQEWLRSFRRRRGDYKHWEDNLGGNDWGHKEQMRVKCREMEKKIKQLERQKEKEERQQNNNEWRLPEINLPPIPILNPLEGSRQF